MGGKSARQRDRQIEREREGDSERERERGPQTNTKAKARGERPDWELHSCFDACNVCHWEHKSEASQDIHRAEFSWAGACRQNRTWNTEHL